MLHVGSFLSLGLASPHRSYPSPFKLLSASQRWWPQQGLSHLCSLKQGRQPAIPCAVSSSLGSLAAESQSSRCSSHVWAYRSNYNADSELSDSVFCPPPPPTKRGGQEGKVFNKIQSSNRFKETHFLDICDHLLYKCRFQPDQVLALFTQRWDQHECAAAAVAKVETQLLTVPTCPLLSHVARVPS